MFPSLMMCPREVSCELWAFFDFRCRVQRSGIDDGSTPHLDPTCLLSMLSILPEVLTTDI